MRNPGGQGPAGDTYDHDHVHVYVYVHVNVQTRARGFGNQPGRYPAYFRAVTDRSFAIRASARYGFWMNPTSPGVVTRWMASCSL